jgi:hypothetical protein
MLPQSYPNYKTVHRRFQAWCRDEFLRRISVSTHAANHHEVRLAQLCFDFYMIEAKPENWIGDRAYDSDPLDEELRRDGIEMIAPHRANRSKPPKSLGSTLERARLAELILWDWQVMGIGSCSH